MKKKDIPNAIIETMVTAAIVLDDELRVLFINAAAETLIQVSATQAADHPLTDLILLEDRVVEALHETMESLQPFTERDAVIRLPDNINVNVDFTVNFMERSRGKPRLLVELQPLNRLKRINKDDESITRQETARQLIRGLAHEVKNPLGGIRGAAQLLEQELDSSAYTEYTQVIISEADRLTALVDSMLGPQRQLQLDNVNMLKVTEHVIQLVEAERPGYITWRRDYDPSLPDLVADEGQLIQAVMNIVKNACEALEDTDEPRIHLRSRGIRQFTIGHTVHRLVMQLDITDNGPGIDPELESRIFFPMISGNPNGSGLGLAITQTVITQHHGSIQVTSRPGQTCFTIYLPFEQPVNQEAATL